MVLAVAYGSAAPSLAVAEFAPTANDALEAPPTTNSAEQSTANGGRKRSSSTQPPAATSTTESPSSADPGSAPTTRVGRGRPCYGEPPRQLPDPRSPACIPTIFEGDNGGATATGVTATEIRVAISPGNQPGTEALVAYLNRHFELYGRRIVPVIVPNVPSSSDPSGQRAYADSLAAEGIFAVIARPLNARWLTGTFQTLARHGVVLVADGTGTMITDREFDEFHPYLWSVGASVEQVERQQADFICRSLAGRPPQHAPEMSQSEPRRFGIISIADLTPPRTRPLAQGLEACGAEPAATAEVAYLADTANGIRNAIERLKSAGVTTLVCACGDTRGQAMLDALSASGWLPEIVGPLSIKSGIEEARINTSLKGALRTRLFGLQPYSRVVPPQAQWWFAAALENDANIDFSAGYDLATEYDEWLLLAAGLQAAGPVLTPQTFGAGLMASPFPNAEVGNPPHYVPSVGFGPGDHGFVNDFSLVWWSDDADSYTPASPQQTKGSWCYLDGGVRFTIGTYPTNADDRFYNPAEPCR